MVSRSHHIGRGGTTGEIASYDRHGAQSRIADPLRHAAGATRAEPPALLEYSAWRETWADKIYPQM
jgi:hypothetical protein